MYQGIGYALPRLKTSAGHTSDLILKLQPSFWLFGSRRRTAPVDSLECKAKRQLCRRQRRTPQYQPEPCPAMILRTRIDKTANKISCSH